jgi:hypothetical protein
MAVVLYANGIIEEFKSSGIFFSEEELIASFSSWDKVRSLRLIEVPNIWCI